MYSIIVNASIKTTVHLNVERYVTQANKQMKWTEQKKAL